MSPNDLVPIPGGTFLMGSPSGEAGRTNEEGPQHPVTIRPFWMEKTETTWDEYDQYWRKKEEGTAKAPETPADKAADAVTRPTPPYADETFGHGREKHPVLCITHHAAYGPMFACSHASACAIVPSCMSFWRLGTTNATAGSWVKSAGKELNGRFVVGAS